MQREKAGIDELFEYFRINMPTRREEIKAALKFFDSVPNSFNAVCNFKTNKFIYLSENVTKWLGHPAEEFIEKGFKMLFEINKDVDVAKMIARQQEYLRKMTEPGFDYTVPFLVEFAADYRRADNVYVPVYQMAVVLEFEPGGDTRTFFTIWIETSAAGKIPVPKPVIKRALKEFNRLIFGPGITNGRRDSSTELIKIKAPYYQAPRLTKKEKELLLYLSQGLPLKSIAAKMKVSYFTSESHRKSLFQKFDVKNVAELIQKATKIYWME